MLARLDAFLLVMALFELFGEQLRSQPLAVIALVISGVLVVVMANVVIPALGRILGRWLPPRPAEEFLAAA